MLTRILPLGFRAKARSEGPSGNRALHYQLCLSDQHHVDKKLASEGKSPAESEEGCNPPRIEGSRTLNLDLYFDAPQ